MINDYLSEIELKEMNFGSLGKKVSISRRSVFYNPKNVKIGSNVRIDSFCIFQNSNTLIIGDYSHISSYVFVCGCEKILLKGKNGIGPYVSIYSSINNLGSKKVDYLNKKNKSLVFKKEVILEKFSIVGEKSQIFPGVILRKGSAIASYSKVTKSTAAWTIYGHVNNMQNLEILGKRK